MDVTYHTTPGAYFHSARQFGGFIVHGSPSPPLSLCSEPILQLPMSDGRFGSPGQQKPPKVQLLNKTIANAQKKKAMVRGPQLTSRIEPPDMMNFFQTLVPFSNHLSESQNGNIRTGSVNPPFPSRNNSYTFSPPEHPFQCTPVAYPNCFPQVEQQGPVSFVPCWGQNQQNSEQRPECNGSATSTWRHPAIPVSALHPPNMTIELQLQNGTSTQNFPTIEKECPDSGRRQRKHVKPNRETVGASKNITRNWDALKRENRKRNVLLPKQRKRIQQKNKALHKTELCTHWMLTSTCKYKSKCYFAHGIDELQKRVRVLNYKTRPCADCPPENRKCMFGSRCNYCHPGEAIRRRLDSSYFDKDYFKDLSKEFKDNEYPFGIFI